MFTYEMRAAMADEHQARMLAQAETARMVRNGTGRRHRGSWLTWFRRSSPSLVLPLPEPERRVRDRRVAQVPVRVDRRAGYDRRAASNRPFPDAVSQRRTPVHA